MSKDSRVRVPGFPGSPVVRALATTAAAVLAIAAASPAAFAAWSPAGYPFSTAAGEQSSLRAVTDGRGGFLAAWVDTNGGTPRIFSQRVDSTGATQWTAGGVLVNSGFSGVAGLVAAPDGANGLLLAWTADRAVTRKNIYVQRLNASGAPVWPANGLLVDPTSPDTVQGTPAIVSDGAGGAIVAWVENRGATDDDVFIQRILADSSRAWLAGGVGADSTDGEPQANPRLLADGAGGAWLSWEDVQASDTQTFFQRFDASGARQWTDGGVTSSSSSSVQALMARIPGTDSLVVAWSDANSTRIEGTKLTPAGAFVSAGGVQLLNTASPPAGLIALAGGASRLLAASAGEVQSVAVTSAGTAGSPVTLATGQTLAASSNLSAAGDGGNGYFAVWASAGAAYARHVTPAGAADWAGAVPLTSGVTPAQTWPVAVPGSDLLTAWVDGRNAGSSGPDLYSQRVSPSGVTGTYFRINATIAAGSGAFSSGGGRSWVRQGDSLRVRFAGTSGQHVDHVVVGATSFAAVPNYTFHDVAADSTLQAHFSGAPIVSQDSAYAGQYRAFSVPATLSPATVAGQFANLMPYDPVRWRLGHYEADDSMYLDPSTTPALTSIVPGAGYWFIGLKDTLLSFSGTAVAETQFNLPMLGGPASGRGWTQFGSPFRFPVAVSQLRLSSGPDVPISDPGNTLTDPQVLEWKPATASYSAVSVLLPGRAYWLWRQSASALSLRFPFEWNPVATGGLEPALATLGDWSVSVTARAGAREAGLVLGAAPVAAGRWNRLSAHALPAGPGDALDLVARVSDWGDDNGGYASVFRPDAETLAWDFEASAGAGLTESVLSFAFTDLPAGRRVVLTEPATGWSREIAAGAAVPVVLSGDARRFRLEVLAGGPVAPGAPLVTALRAVGPNPFRVAATLSFSLARTGPLRWDVFDLAGRRVVSGARTLTAGEHTLTWDGRDDAGRSVRPGLYLLRWRADGRSGSARLVRTD